MGSLEKLGLRIRCVVRDPVLGTIPIYEHEYEVLQLPEVNRLHHLKQVGMLYNVFPSAKHSRFEHSLGAMHIAGRIVETMLCKLMERGEVALRVAVSLLSEACAEAARLRSKLKQCTSVNDVRPELEALFSYVVLYERLAALLHDVGHLAFGHSTEGLLEALIEASPGDAEEFERLRRRGVKPHEYMAYKVVVTSEGLKEAIKRVGELPQLGLSPKPETVASVILGEAVSPSVELSQAAINVMHEVIGSDVDADRLDFVARDAYMSGVPISVDVDRLVEGFTLCVGEERGGRASVAIAHDVKSLAALEAFMLARVKMYELAYHHHKSVAYDVIVGEALAVIGRLGRIAGLCGVKDVSELARALTSGDVQLLTDYDFLRRLAAVAARVAGWEGEELRYYVKCLKDRRFLPMSIVKRRGEVPSLEPLMERLAPAGQASEAAIREALTRIEGELRARLNSRAVREEVARKLSEAVGGADLSRVKVICKALRVSTVGALGAPPLVEVSGKCRPLTELSPAAASISYSSAAPVLYAYLAYIDYRRPVIYEASLRARGLKPALRSYLRGVMEDAISSMLSQGRSSAT